MCIDTRGGFDSSLSFLELSEADFPGPRGLRMHGWAVRSFGQEFRNFRRWGRGAPEPRGELPVWRPAMLYRLRRTALYLIPFSYTASARDVAAGRYPCGPGCVVEAPSATDARRCSEHRSREWGHLMASATNATELSCHRIHLLSSESRNMRLRAAPADPTLQAPPPPAPPHPTPPLPHSSTIFTISVNTLVEYLVIRTKLAKLPKCVSSLYSLWRTSRTPTPVRSDATRTVCE